MQFYDAPKKMLVFFNCILEKFKVLKKCTSFFKLHFEKILKILLGCLLFTLLHFKKIRKDFLCAYFLLMFEQPLLFIVYWSIQFFNSPFSWKQSVRAHLVPFPSLCSAYVTDGMACHSMLLKYFPPNTSHPYLWKLRISLGVESVLKMFLCPHS